MVEAKLMFTVSVTADKPVLVGQDNVNGRRQLINCPQGTVDGVDPDGKAFTGVTLPCTVDSQVIRPNGVAELSARYGIRLDDGRSFYIENNGIRTVPPEYTQVVLNGGFVDPSLYYFVTTPKIEAYDDSLRWMERNVFLCKAERTPDTVVIHYYMVEK